MLDINLIENNLDDFCERLKNRQTDYSKELKKAIILNKERKNIIKKVEEFRAQRNSESKIIGDLVRNKKNDEAEKIKLKLKVIENDQNDLENKLKIIENEINDILLFIPNLPNENIPIGSSEEENKEIRKWGKDLRKNSEPHWEIAEKLGLVDFKSGPKLSGSRFLVYTGKGSKLVRAIADIMLNEHTKRGYTEMFVPVIVNEEMMIGTGNLPKFKDDAYKVGDQYLIPTAEVPLTNLYRKEVIEEKNLPIKITAFSQCFRQEAGSAGRDTKGMIRLHQFNKVEMVKITDQNSSYEELEEMVLDAENILKVFELPYRVIELCSGDIGFSSMKTYDLEVWFPSQQKYREISSCSNCGDFQARRMMTRYKNSNGETKLVHTLNGSGVAIDRLFAALLENFYDGKELVLPKVLKKYFPD